jgi:hypothetical protein
VTSSGLLKVINIKPGINKNDSPYQSEGTYVSCQWMRFQHDNPKKMGGWQTVPTSATYDGVARDSTSWVDLRGDRWFAVGTNSQLSIYNGQLFTDITPVLTSAYATSAFSTTNGSAVVAVSVAGFAPTAGDYVAITSVNVANLVLNGTYAITSVGSANFDINAGTTANASLAWRGDTTIQLLIPTGRVDAGAVGGWGSGPWGGTGSTGWGVGVTSVDVDLRTWVLDTWGEDLIANYRGGGIYLWDRTLGTGVRAAQISGAPTQANSIAVINPPRILCVYGCSAYLGDFDPLLVRWSSNEDYTAFNPAVTNASGELRLQDGNEIIRAIPSKQETVIFTDTGVYRQNYIGGDFVFSIEKAGSNCGLIGPQAAVDVNGVVYWMSPAGFYLYNGAVQKLDCTVYDNIFNKTYGDGLNYTQQYKVHCGVNTEFSEIVWFYPSRDAPENDRYVIYNYQDGLWYDGIISRTTWIDASVFSRPIATGVSSTTFYHEVGVDADSVAIPARLQTGQFDIESGDNLFLVDQYIPDYKNLSGDFNVQFAFKKFPDSNEESVKGPFHMSNKNVLYFRGRGRTIQMSYSLSGVGSNIQIGKTRLRIKPDGLR